MWRKVQGGLRVHVISVRYVIILSVGGSLFSLHLISVARSCTFFWGFGCRFTFDLF